MTSISATTIIEVPEPEPQHLLLIPRPTEPTKGRRLPEPEPLEKRLVVGIDAQQVKLGVAGTPDPQEFPGSEFADFRFFLVHLAVTTLADQAEPFVQVDVDVPLQNSESSAQAIAWSMAPDRLDDKIELSRAFTLSAALKVVGIGPAEVGPEAGWTRGMKYEKKTPFLLAKRELTAEPGWRLLRTKGTAIDGITRLSLVVRAPAGITATGTVKLSASVERAHLGILHRFLYDAELPDRKPVPFTLS